MHVRVAAAVLLLSSCGRFAVDKVLEGQADGGGVLPPKDPLADGSVRGSVDALAAPDVRPEPDGNGGFAVSPPALQAGVFTVAGAARSGSLLLSDDGFELGPTLCQGTLCLTGAVTP